jgi:hypothetical protein
MEPRSSSDLKFYVSPRVKNLSAEEVRTLYSAPLAIWLATVALVLIVICLALSLAARREHQKRSQAIGAQIATLSALEDCP